MACPNCPQVPLEDAPPPEVPGHVMRETLVHNVVGVDGRTYSLNQPLVPAGQFPRNHCSAVLVVAGIPRLIDEPSCVQVFNEAMRLYQLNGSDFWFINIWLNLNLQWIPRVAAKYRLVTVDQLEAISFIPLTTP